MGDMIKGFFLLVLAIAGLAVAYVSWLVLVPVTESDAQFRLSNVCYGGQWLAAAVNGPNHRALSCDCVSDGLVKSVGVPVMAKGLDVMRQQLAAQLWRAASGETPDDHVEKLMADREVLQFMFAAQRLDRECKISAFAAGR